MGMQYRMMLSAIFLLLAGCASGPLFSEAVDPPAGKAQVYLFRPMVMAGGGMSHKVMIDGKSYSTLPNGSWMRVTLEPGSHALQIEDYLGLMRCGPFPMRFDLEAGKTVFIENEVRMVSYTAPVVQTGCRNIVRSEAEAIPAIKQTRSSQGG